MSNAFRVYIDESGDEGFTFHADGSGSSRWFVLSAAVTREELDLDTVRLVQDARDDLQKGRSFVLHFQKLSHKQRLPYLKRIAAARLRTVSVLVHKPTLREPEKFQADRDLLYAYATRYLLERVSWLCRDHNNGSGYAARIIFEHRRSLSYPRLREYMDRLKHHTASGDVRIDWQAIDPARIEARGKGELMGLQIADAVASSFYQAMETDRHGFTEPRYAGMLRPVTYNRKRTYLGYGLKLWPRSAGECPGREHAWLDAFQPTQQT